MIRRRMPWFLVALLFFVWAVDLADSHLRNAQIPRGDALQTSLLYFDHSLRLEETAEHKSHWVQWLVYQPDHEESLGQARDSLESFEETGDFNAEARRALAVIRADLGSPQDDLSQLDELTRAVMLGEDAPEASISELTGKIRSGNGAWWDGRLAGLVAERQPDGALLEAIGFQRSRDESLFRRTAIAFTAVWLLSILGLAFVPHTFRVIRNGWTTASLHRPVRYSSRWEPSLVVGMLLAFDLLAGYFISEVYASTSGLKLGLTFDIAADTVWRLLAPGLALVILFRKPSHAIRSLGLDRAPRWRVILATFAVLSWLNFGFSLLTEPWVEFDPTGGLDLMENGWSGLVYGLLSACVIAPIAEETFYRGLLLRGLERRFGFWLSASVVTLAFSLAHFYDAFGLVSVGMLGFAMVVVYRTTGSLTTVIVFHGLYNFTITLPNWLLYHMK